MSNPHDEEYWEYEMGVEGEYEYPLPPGYESWAEWHYINGDRMPDESDYYEEYVDEYETINLGLSYDYTYDIETDTYYIPKTGERLTQKQLDALADVETARINAIAARLEERNRIYEEVRKRRQRSTQQSTPLSIRMSKAERKRKAAELGVHPDMFTRNDADCWKFIRDTNTWLYKHPRIYSTLKFIMITFLILVILFDIIVFFFLD